MVLRLSLMVILSLRGSVTQPTDRRWFTVELNGEQRLRLCDHVQNCRSRVKPLPFSSILRGYALPQQ
jgi:hypothetical protein